MRRDWPMPIRCGSQTAVFWGVSIYSFVSFSLEWPMTSVATISSGSNLAASVPE